MRDTFMSNTYWNEYLSWLDRSIRGFEERLAMEGLTIDDQKRLRVTLFDRQLERCIAQYSSGEDVALLQHPYAKVVEAFDAYRRVHDYAPVMFEEFDNYVHALWLIALAVLLDVDEHILNQLYTLINNNGQDAIYDRLAALRSSKQPVSTHVFYPQPYKYLYQALLADGIERDVAINKFLRQYYKGMRRAYWYNRHLNPVAGFFGYWCFELAAFVKMLSIPDQQFSTHPYYPQDLAAGHRDSKPALPGR